MNSKQKQRRAYLLKKGLVKSPATTLKRTEAGKIYRYPVGLSLTYQAWFSKQLDEGRQPMFAAFIETLPDDLREKISIEYL